MMGDQTADQHSCRPLIDLSSSHAETYRTAYGLLPETDTHQHSIVVPPPQPILPLSYNAVSDIINTGLNIYFKKVEPFSQDPKSGGGPLNPPQASIPGMPIDYPVFSTYGQTTLSEYMQGQIENIVYCRYGLEYIQAIQTGEQKSIGSYNINLDQLIINKQKLLQNESTIYFGRAAMLQRQNLNGKSSPIKKANIILPYYKEQDNTSLSFDSIFESGNLAMAIKVSNKEYDLILQNDVNTTGHTQWFYFKVSSNFKTTKDVKFNIINLQKRKSLYSQGLRVLGLNLNQENPIWERTGTNISYLPNSYIKEAGKSYYTLSFTCKIKAGQQQMQFAHSVPYTYSMLNDYLSQTSRKRMLLCHTLAGNRCEYLLITNQKSPVKNKQVVFLTSRVHPGETNASWMMKGLLDMLLKPSPDEVETVNMLKDYFEFYIIPMLNVDGVINGNYRCSLAACDLNRKYLNCSKVLHPTIYHTKLMCKQLKQQGKEFFLYLDFHGHSVKKNVFQYGNKLEALSQRYRKDMIYTPPMFSHFLSKQFDYFNYQDCSFNMPKSKESTARITMFHMLKIPFVFTLEASFAGASKGCLAGQHFSIGDLENIGKHVLRAIYQTKKLENNKVLLKEIASEVESIPISDQNSDSDGEGDAESDSSSEDEAQVPNDESLIKSLKEFEIVDLESSSIRGKKSAYDGSPTKNKKAYATNRLTECKSAQKSKTLNGGAKSVSPKKKLSKPLGGADSSDESREKTLGTDQTFQSASQLIQKRREKDQRHIAHTKNNSMVSYFQLSEMNSMSFKEQRPRQKSKLVLNQVCIPLKSIQLEDRISHKSSRNLNQHSQDMSLDRADGVTDNNCIESFLQNETISYKSSIRRVSKPYQRINRGYKYAQLYQQQQQKHMMNKSNFQTNHNFSYVSPDFHKPGSLYGQITVNEQRKCSMDENSATGTNFNIVRHAQILKQYVQLKNNSKLTSDDLQNVKDLLQGRLRKQAQSVLGKCINNNFPEIVPLNKDKQTNQQLITYDQEYQNKTFHIDKFSSKHLFGSSYQRKRVIQGNSGIMTQETSPTLNSNYQKSKFSSKNSPTNKEYRGVQGFGDIVLTKCSISNQE